MIPPDKPETEVSRLNTLTSLSVLDTAEEERFNRLTRIARKTFNVPIALVSLVDENRQWFKSCLGLDVRETSRDISFCGHAILESKILVISDAAKDERFFDNPLVTKPPYIRFYAGCPLTIMNSRIGTLCIIDTVPRTLSEEELLILKDLSSLVENELSAIQLSAIDELTKVPNRRGLLSLIQSGLNLCQRQKIPSTLIFFDLNGFKGINDTYGHDEGDKALVVFADILTEACRDADIVGRLGGDEFVTWLSNSNMETSETFLKRLTKLLELKNQQNRMPYIIEFSSGMVHINPNEKSSVDNLLREADKLMYKNKKKRG